MPANAPTTELTAPDKARLDSLTKWFTENAEPEHKRYEEAWDNQDRLYYGHKRFLQAHSSARQTTKGRDVSLRDARKEFGEELHVPYVFATMETIFPRMLSSRPKMLWTPRDKTAQHNVETVTTVCDAQQERAQYELKLQTTGRNGLKHGIGIGTVFWRFDERDTFAMRPDPNTGEWVRAPVKKADYDDPDCGDINPRDFYWDPYAENIETATRLLRRTWRDTAYCLEKIQSGAWPKYDLSAEELTGSTGKAKYDEAWSTVRRNQGLGGPSTNKDIHEIWEIHESNTNNVVTIIDRMWIVSEMINPYWHGQYPFQIFRPIEVPHRFVGIGVIDPIEDLQRELDWLRTDRRVNAMLKLHQAYAFNDGLVDPAQIKIGPGRLNPVNGDPKDLLVPLTVGDIPNSGYQEEAALRGDIELASGMSDQLAGAGSAGETATGVQLVQASAGIRIQAYSHRMELEFIAPQASQWLALNQQRWISERDVPFPDIPDPLSGQQRWKWRQVGPAEMAGEFEVKPSGGSMAPENTPQKRNDAMLWMQLALSPIGMQLMDGEKTLEQILQLLDADAPQKFIRQPDSIPAETMPILMQALVEQGGMRPEGAMALLQGAIQQAHMQREEQAQAQARGVGGPQSGQQQPMEAQNGAGPTPAPTQG